MGFIKTFETIFLEDKDTKSPQDFRELIAGVKKDSLNRRKKFFTKGVEITGLGGCKKRINKICQESHLARKIH